MPEAISKKPKPKAMSKVPEIAFGYPIRNPSDSEDIFFRQNPHISGRATEDNSIILNPYTKLKPEERQSVILNEASRLFMRENNLTPRFGVTKKQMESFKGSAYERAPDAMRQTIAARMLSGDPSASYGFRKDGTLKGSGFLGELKRPDGRVSTELSIGVNFDGKGTEIPALVPTLTKQEINHLLSGGKITKEIVSKAVEHARKRIAEGESPFHKSDDDKIMEQQKRYADKILNLLKKRQ